VNRNWKLEIGNLKFFCILSFLFIQIYAEVNSYPISHYTDFKVESKSSNQIDIKITNDATKNSDGINKIVEEFNSTGIPYIYQSKLIAIPENGNIQVIVKNYDSLIIPYNQVINITQDEFNNDNFPIAYLGQSGIMRDFKIAPLNVRQYFYNKTTKNIICYSKVDVEIEFSEPVTILSSASQISNDWISFYQNSILNFDESSIEPFNLGLPQVYLIIVADDLYNNILPLARWKNLKGWTVTVKRKSEVGTTYTEIKNYIAQAYSTWTPRIEYVLLVGTGTSGAPTNYIPPIPGYATYGDHLYSCVSGNDLYPDLFIGRLPASTASELAVMVAKIIGYEQTPYLSDTLWYKRALMVATSYQQSGVPVWTALAIKRYLRNFLLEHNYNQVDTVFYPPTASGVGKIDTIINRGVTFVNGRGWGNREGWNYPYFKLSEVNNLNNGWKLPVVTSFYCATGNFTAAQCFGTTFLTAGSPTNPKGAVAFYGPIYATTSTRFNNCQDYSIYWGIFEEKIYNCGPAMFRGKIELLNNFPSPSDSLSLDTHVNTYNLLGDPSLDMWIGTVPKPLVVNYPSEIPVGSSSVTITVRNSIAQPISGALVSLYKTNEIKKCAFTDNSGNATFDFTTQTSDTLFVTVTMHNYIPHLGNIQVTAQPVYVGFYSYSGSTIAGQTANLTISLKNFGSSQTANNTIAKLRTQDNHIAIIDSVKSYGNITPGQIIAGGPFQFTIATNCTNNHRVNFQLAIISESNNWQAGFSISISTAELSYANHTVSDGGNNILDPGETSNLIVKIFNRGMQNISNVSGILRCTNPNAIRVTDSIGYFGNINAGDSIQNNTDYFIVQASPSIGIGRKFYFQLLVRSGNYERLLEFPIIIGNVTSTSASGPDGYGYWAYDNTDIAYNECPTYSWFEIDPNYSGAGTQITLGDEGIRTLNLPFTFRYYGNNYTKISICSDGYAALDSSVIVDPYNWSIPSPLGPRNMLAIMWDDFHPDTLNASGVYYYYDVSNNRFIIEWSRVYHVHGFRDPYLAEQQTFQILLLNQTYYPTRTGDGSIIYQYHTVANDDSFSIDCHNYATVGIENYSQDIGIEYTFANQYHPASAPLVNGRAIKFTTNLPDTFNAIAETDPKIYIQHSGIELRAFPNPMYTQTKFEYNLTFNGEVKLQVYDISGKIVKTLINSDNQSAGNYQVFLKKKDISSGVYFALLTIKQGNHIITKQIKISIY
jgi:hypothetical protein